MITIGKATLHNMDCMEYMATMPDKAFDLAIIDPPYGIGEDGGAHKHNAKPNKAWANPNNGKYQKKDWDNKVCSEEYFEQLFRVSKNQIIWGANHFIDKFAKPSPCWIVWYKAGQNPNTDYADCELAWASFKRAVKYFNFPWIGFGAVNAKETRIHPTQKPVKLYEWLLTNYAKQGQRILDTHLGSGSHAIACNNLGFELVGCELDKDYFEAACKRIEQATAQERMFP